MMVEKMVWKNKPRLHKCLQCGKQTLWRFCSTECYDKYYQSHPHKPSKYPKSKSWRPDYILNMETWTWHKPHKSLMLQSAN